jgi:putative ABC transport system ATP-binding protein
MSFITLHDVHKTYRLGETLVPALRGRVARAAAGRVHRARGPLGLGQEHAAQHGGLHRRARSRGRLVEGRDVAHLSDDERSRLRNEKIGFIFQSFNLIPVLDVYENVELPLLINERIAPGERRDRVMQAIRDVELETFTRQLPDKLSGGQRQRVAIARALVTSPLLVLADEPTANLDSGTTHRIIDLMLALNDTRGVTFFFSTHDEKLMSRVARIVHISDGAIVPALESQSV